MLTIGDAIVIVAFMIVAGIAVLIWWGTRQ
jgi:hypothetical protein